MLAMGPRDLNSAPYSPFHCSSHSMRSLKSSELTELPVVENGQLFAQRAHSTRYAPTQFTQFVALFSYCTPPPQLLSGQCPPWGGGVHEVTVPRRKPGYCTCAQEAMHKAQEEKGSSLVKPPWGGGGGCTTKLCHTITV